MVVLATKCYVGGDARGRAIQGFNSLVDNEIGDLDVEWEIDVRDDDFLAVDLEGEDATVAGNVLAESWGEIVTEFEPGETDNDRRFGALSYGFVVGMDPEEYREQEQSDSLELDTQATEIVEVDE
jgi:hypothetical protein